MTEMNHLHRQEYENLASALRKVVWGYILIYLGLSLGTLDILPDWLGYGLLCSALPTLAKYTPSANLLDGFCKVLIGWNLLRWGLNLFGGYEPPQIIAVCFGILTIYFHFQLLTNLAEISDSTGCSHGDRLRMLRTFTTLLQTFLALPVPWESILEITPIAVIPFFLSFGILIDTILILNLLKKELENAA